MAKTETKGSRALILVGGGNGLYPTANYINCLNEVTEYFERETLMSRTMLIGVLELFLLEQRQLQTAETSQEEVHA